MPTTALVTSSHSSTRRPCAVALGQKRALSCLRAHRAVTLRRATPCSVVSSVNAPVCNDCVYVCLGASIFACLYACLRVSASPAACSVCPCVGLGCLAWPTWTRGFGTGIRSCSCGFAAAFGFSLSDRSLPAMGSLRGAGRPGRKLALREGRKTSCRSQLRGSSGPRRGRSSSLGGPLIFSDFAPSKKELGQKSPSRKPQSSKWRWFDRGSWWTPELPGWGTDMPRSRILGGI